MNILRASVLIVSSLISFYTALLLAFATRNLLNHLFGERIIYFDHPLSQYVLSWWMPTTLLICIGYEGLYSARRPLWEDVKASVKALLLYFFIVLGILTLSKTSEDFSRIVMTLSVIYLLPIYVISRYISLTALHKYGYKEKIRFIGPGESLEFFKNKVLNDRYLGFELGEPAYIVFISTSEPNWEKKFNELQKEFHKVYIFDDKKEYIRSEFKYHFLLGTDISFLEFENRLKDRSKLLFKRIFDVCSIIIALPVLAPVMLLIGVLIKLDSKGAVFFVQERVGKDGKLFKCYKFRTMFTNSEDRLFEVLNENPDMKEEWERYYKLKDDPRVTRIGRFLRRFSLDELPQIINVLMGDMSLVGPRPVTQEELDKYYGEFASYYKETLPGITGLWQISGRSDINYEGRVKLDTWYILNWSPWLDFIILIKTIRVVIRGEGAY